VYYYRKVLLLICSRLAASSLHCVCPFILSSHQIAFASFTIFKILLEVQVAWTEWRKTEEVVQWICGFFCYGFCQHFHRVKQLIFLLQLNIKQVFSLRCYFIPGL